MKRSMVLWVCLITLAISVIGCLFIIIKLGWISTALDNLPKPQAVPAGQYKITDVYDGDTFAVDMNGQIEKVRLIGVDTPETHDPDKPVQCYGKEASKYSRNLLLGNNVRLEADPTNNNRDRYNRLLRYAYLGNTLINKDLIEKGYGFAYTPFEFQKKDEFLIAENNAQLSKLGLWSVCETFVANGVMQTTSVTE